jgi:hypothetical protein
MKRSFLEMRRTLRAMRSGQYENMTGGINFIYFGNPERVEQLVLLFKLAMKTLI